MKGRSPPNRSGVFGSNGEIVDRGNLKLVTQSADCVKIPQLCNPRGNRAAASRIAKISAEPAPEVRAITEDCGSRAVRPTQGAPSPKGSTIRASNAAGKCKPAKHRSQVRNLNPPGRNQWAEIEKISAELDAEERAGECGEWSGPLYSARGAPYSPYCDGDGSAVFPAADFDPGEGYELVDFAAGKTLFPAWVSGARPFLTVRLPRSHVAAARRNARRQEQHELEHGDRDIPRFDFDLVDPRDGVASSTSARAIIEAEPGFGCAEAEQLRERLKLPVVDCPFSRSMELHYREDHFAGGCRLCSDPSTEPSQRIAGLHCDCFAARVYVNGTRGVRARFAGALPDAVCMDNYETVGDYPDSVEKNFMKQWRAGGFGRRRVRYENKFDERTYRGKMPRADGGLLPELVTSTKPARCAPLGAAMRYADVLKAELAGVSPKVRLIYDLTKVGINGATFGGRRWRFRYAGPDALLPYLRRGSYCASFDLSKFYQQIPVDDATAGLFGVRVPHLSAEHLAEIGAKGRGPHYTHYRSLPMGWMGSCAHASVVSASICEEAVRRGARCCVAYIDDLCMCGDTYAECARSQAIVRSVIEERFGLKINQDKTEEPQLTLEWIGFTIDTVTGEFTVSEERLERIAQEIEALLAQPRPSAAKLRSLLGRLSWLAMVMKGARAYTSPLFTALRGRRSSERVDLTPRHREDLRWFLKHIRGGQWRGSAWLDGANDEPVYTKSDAGDDAVFLVSEGRFVWHELTAAERALSSHARELLPAVLAAKIFGPEWRGKVVAMSFDNSGTAFTVSRMSSRTDDGARDMLRAIADANVEHNFAMIGVWGQRATNVLCDAGSKLTGVVWDTNPLRVDYSASERAAAKLPVGAGCWLYPRFRCSITDSVMGYVSGDERFC